MKPTATDANLVLGLLDADRFLGGRIKPNRQCATQAITRRIGRQVDATTEDLALAIWSTVTENSAR